MDPPRIFIEMHAAHVGIQDMHPLFGVSEVKLAVHEGGTSVSISTPREWLPTHALRDADIAPASRLLCVSQERANARPITALNLASHTRKKRPPHCVDVIGADVRDDEHTQGTPCGGALCGAVQHRHHDELSPPALPGGQMS